ncbi:MAG: hypothetical protein GC180_09565 [Bacteroidetes bacterium]|nr:hypothetical protein [Bacteroidota bacterium]
MNIRNLVLAFTLSLAAYSALAQENGESFDSNLRPKDTGIIYKIVEDTPEFPGGETAMFKYISDNRWSLSDGREHNIQGRVVAQFGVDEKGEVTDIEVRNMPGWNPGMQKGIAVEVQYVLPIRFYLGVSEKPKKKKLNF